MTTYIGFTKLPTKILKRVIKFREKIETLEHGMEALLKEALIGGDGEPGPKRGRKKVSAATKRKMALAARERWAKKNGGTVKAVKKGRRKMSAATKAKMAAAAKARWKAAKAAGKTTL